MSHIQPYTTSETSESSVFEALAQRDQFLGVNRCIVCGFRNLANILEHCYIIAKGDDQKWLDLKYHKSIPPEAKDSPQDDPHNLMLLCPNHRICFETGAFIIRFSGQARRFVFVNCSKYKYLKTWDQKAVALTVDDAPYPALFKAHEAAVLQDLSFTPSISDDESIHCQDWIVEYDVFDEVSQCFRR